MQTEAERCGCWRNRANCATCALVADIGDEMRLISSRRSKHMSVNDEGGQCDMCGAFMHHRRHSLCYRCSTTCIVCGGKKSAISKHLICDGCTAK